MDSMSLYLCLGDEECDDDDYKIIKEYILIRNVNATLLSHS